MIQRVPGIDQSGGSFKADAVSRYKQYLREIIDKRPSGTRQLIASALGKHKSFVTQITNPSYAVPVPAKHLPTILDICHFSPTERHRFVELYQAAHPDRHVTPEAGTDGAAGLKRISIEVPILRSPTRQEEMEQMVRDFARRIGALADR